MPDALTIGILIGLLVVVLILDIYLTRDKKI